MLSYSLEVCQNDLRSNSDPHTHWQDTRGNHDSSLVGESCDVHCASYSAACSATEFTKQQFVLGTDEGSCIL